MVTEAVNIGVVSVRVWNQLVAFYQLQEFGDVQ